MAVAVGIPGGMSANSEKADAADLGSEEEEEEEAAALHAVGIG